MTPRNLRKPPLANKTININIKELPSTLKNNRRLNYASNNQKSNTQREMASFNFRFGSQISNNLTPKNFTPNQNQFSNKSCQDRYLKLPEINPSIVQRSQNNFRTQRLNSICQNMSPKVLNFNKIYHDNIYKNENSP